jgi:hypothetical protein
MVQASTSAAFTADRVRAGTVLAAEMIAKAAVLIAAAAAIHLMGEGRKPRGAGAAEPPANLHAPAPLRRGAVFFRGRGRDRPCTEQAMPMDAVYVLTVVVLAFGGMAAAFAWAEAQNHDLSK